MLIFSALFQLLIFCPAVNDWLAGGLGNGSCKPIVPNEAPPEGNIKMMRRTVVKSDSKRLNLHFRPRRMWKWQIVHL